MVLIMISYIQVNQENGGHGIAVMKAVSHADGVYFKNIDSDDWVDGDALKTFLQQPAFAYFYLYEYTLGF